MAARWRWPAALLVALSPLDRGLLPGPRLVAAQIYKCHERCHRCHLFDYDMTWHCLECEPGYDLWVDGCFLPCPVGQYRYGHKCQSCVENCNSCVGSMQHECTECAKGYHFDIRSLCVKDCRDGFASGLDGVSCDPCSSYCKTCLSKHRISCTSCFEGYTLRVLDANTSSGECMQECPKGFYRDASTDMRCIQCGEYCLECDAIESCRACEERATLYRGICYLIPAFAADSAIDFDTYMNSGTGLPIPIDDPSGPKWEDLFETRRLQERRPAAQCARRTGEL